MDPIGRRERRNPRGGIDWSRSGGGGGAGLSLIESSERGREKDREREAGLVVGDGWWIGSEKVGLSVEEEES